MLENHAYIPVRLFTLKLEKVGQAEDTTEEKTETSRDSLVDNRAKPSFFLPAQLIGIKTCQIGFLEFRERHFQDVHIVIYLGM